MVGNIDTPADMDATRRCLRVGITQPGWKDSESFMLGYQLGFMAGYRYGRRDQQCGAVYASYDAYQRDAQEVEK